MLNTVVTGQNTENSPLLIAHGLYGSARNWGVIAKRLSEKRQVVAVDMRNHGESPWHSSHSYHDLAGDLAEIIAHHGGKMDVLGHSMGGKAAMVLGVEHPQTVNRLIVADIAPIPYSHTQIHLIDAMLDIDPAAVTSRGDADRLLSQSLDDAGVRAFLLQSLDIKGQKWRLNHETLAAEMDAIIGFPELNGLFNGPTLFLSGGVSDYVKSEYRPEIKRLFPAARFAKIPGAGHWLHAEKPREFEAAVRAFLEQ